MAFVGIKPKRSKTVKEDNTILEQVNNFTYLSINIYQY